MSPTCSPINSIRHCLQSFRPIAGYDFRATVRLARLPSLLPVCVDMTVDQRTVEFHIRFRNSNVSVGLLLPRRRQSLAIRWIAGNSQRFSLAEGFISVFATGRAIDKPLCHAMLHHNTRTLISVNSMFFASRSFLRGQIVLACLLLRSPGPQENPAQFLAKDRAGQRVCVETARMRYVGHPTNDLKRQ